MAGRKGTIVLVDAPISRVDHRRFRVEISYKILLKRELYSCGGS
jgi:hypothetical protein